MAGDSNHGKRARSPCSFCTTPVASQRWSSVMTKRKFGLRSAACVSAAQARTARSKTLACWTKLKRRVFIGCFQDCSWRENQGHFTGLSVKSFMVKPFTESFRVNRSTFLPLTRETSTGRVWSHWPMV